MKEFMAFFVILSPFSLILRVRLFALFALSGLFPACRPRLIARRYDEANRRFDRVNPPPPSLCVSTLFQ